MGGGGLMQLVAYGMQDVYLTGNSQITFFKNLYRRHTNFSVEAVEQTFQSNSAALGNRLVAVISRNGDLLHRLWLEVQLPGSPNLPATGSGALSDQVYVSKLGHALIKSAEVEIGGQRIDKIYGRWMELWHQLSCREEKKAGYEMMTGNLSGDEPNMPQTFANDTFRKLYLPINFWFSKGSAGAALPLIALQYHEVRITIELGSIAEITKSQGTYSAEVTQAMVDSGAALTVSPGSTAELKDANTTASKLEMSFNPKLYSDFFYLDTDERRRFSQMSHEYLVEQLQFTGKEQVETVTSDSKTHSVRLNFNHPTKAIYWTAEPSVKSEANPFYNGYKQATMQIEDDNSNKILGVNIALPDDNSPIQDVGLMLNGHDRFSVRSGDYFTWVQPYQHHTRVPVDSWSGMYSFCLSPEEHQPSGALNFSRIDNAQLKLTFKKADTSYGNHARDVYVYALSYNVLRILSGMGGLAFSN